MKERENYINSEEQYDFFAEKDNFALKVRSFLTTEDTLYKTKDLGEHGTALLFSATQKRQWDLKVFYFLSSAQTENYDILSTFLYQHLRSFSAPNSIQLYVFIQREYSPIFARPLRINPKLVGLKIVHGLSDLEIDIFAKEKQALLPLPVKKKRITTILILILTCFYVVQIFTGYFFPQQEVFQNWGVSIINLAEKQYLKFAAGVFIHGGIWHFGLNVFALYWLGGFLERHVTAWQYLSIYLCSGFSGAVFSVFFHDGRSVGASGAIFGLLGALMVCICYQKKQWNKFYAWQMQEMNRGLLFILLINFLIPIIYPQIDIWGHLGGILGGGLVAGLFFSRKRYLLALVLGVLLLYLPSVLEQRALAGHKIIRLEKEHRYILELLNTKLLPSIAIIKRAVELRQVNVVPDLQNSELNLRNTADLNFLYHYYGLNWEEVLTYLSVPEQEIFLNFAKHIDKAWQELLQPDIMWEQHFSIWESELSQLESNVLTHYGFQRIKDG